MNIDAAGWIVVILCMTFVTFGGVICRRYMSGVADFVVAGRNVRKFLGLSTLNAEGLGIITVATIAEQGFQHGLSYIWLAVPGIIIGFVLYGLFGFAIMRFRQTKAMTMPEYFEMRYNKRIRLIVGIIAAAAGILNMAIFPIVSSQFLVHFIGLPDKFIFASIQVSTVPALMGVLIFIALLFMFTGGMVSILLTDFLQSILISAAVLGITGTIFYKVGFTGLRDAMISNLGQGAVNPFASGSFGYVWVIMMLISSIYGPVAFPPGLQKIASTDAPKTARQMWLINIAFSYGRTIMILLWGVGALAVLGKVTPEGMDKVQYSRVATALFLGKNLPVLLMGLATAGFLAAFISTTNAYMLTWTSIISNDIICVFKPLSEKQHLWCLRIVGIIVAVFLYTFGVIYTPRETIWEYMILTGVVFQGLGITLVWGMYWKRTTATAALVAILLCTIIPLFDLFGKRFFGQAYPLRAQDSALLALLSAHVAIIGISLLCKKKVVTQ